MVYVLNHGLQNIFCSMGRSWWVETWHMILVILRSIGVTGGCRGFLRVMSPNFFSHCSAHHFTTRKQTFSQPERELKYFHSVNFANRSQTNRRFHNQVCQSHCTYTYSFRHYILNILTLYFARYFAQLFKIKS